MLASKLHDLTRAHLFCAAGNHTPPVDASPVKAASDNTLLFALSPPRENLTPSTTTRCQDTVHCPTVKSVHLVGMLLVLVQSHLAQAFSCKECHFCKAESHLDRVLCGALVCVHIVVSPALDRVQRLVTGHTYYTHALAGSLLTHQLTSRRLSA